MKISFLKPFLKIIFVLVFGVFCFAPFVASANSTHNMSGYAWSSNIGWISFNCTNDEGSSCVKYGVNKNTTTGYLTGYAWSPNIGWIQFGGLSGWPTGSGTTADNAKITGSNLTGWAKALSGGDGSSGWDGWIALSGTGYGVTLDSNSSAPSSCPSTECAWGSEVVGWIDFSGVVVEAAPTIDLTASAPTQNTAIIGTAQTFTSTITNSGNTTTGASFYNSLQVATGAGGAGAVTPLIASTPSPMTARVAGGTGTATAQYTFTGSAGTRSVRFCADQNTSMSGTITESNETNNCSAWRDVTVTASVLPCTLPWGGSIPSGSSVTAYFTSSVDSPDICSSETRPCNNGILGGIGYLNQSCTVNTPPPPPPPGGGTCSSPMKHNKCDGDICSDHSCDTGTPTGSTPSRWYWDCGTAHCSERKTPGYIED